MVRYRVKPERVEEHLGLVRAVFAELEQKRPEGLRYTCLRAKDGLDFVHLALVDAPEGNPLGGLAAFRAFTERVNERCDEPPVTVQLDEVGAYRF